MYAQLETANLLPDDSDSFRVVEDGHKFKNERKNHKKKRKIKKIISYLKRLYHPEFELNGFRVNKKFIIFEKPGKIRALSFIGIYIHRNEIWKILDILKIIIEQSEHIELSLELCNDNDRIFISCTEEGEYLIEEDKNDILNTLNKNLNKILLHLSNLPNKVIVFSGEDLFHVWKKLLGGNIKVVGLTDPSMVKLFNQKEEKQYMLVFRLNTNHDVIDIFEDDFNSNKYIQILFKKNADKLFFTIYLLFRDNAPSLLFDCLRKKSNDLFFSTVGKKRTVVRTLREILLRSFIPLECNLRPMTDSTRKSEVK